MAAPVTEEKGDEALELAAHCLCQAQRFTAQVPRSSLPLEAAYCHCTSCRRVTGALYSSTYIHTMAGRRGGHPRITVAPALRLLGPLDALLLRRIQTSVPPNVAVRGLVDIAHHVFLSDTLVGGASPWLCDANSSDGGQSQELLLPSLHRHWPAAETGASLPSEDTDIPVRCHCGGVDLVLRQPIADFAARKERSELPWFIDPVSNNRQTRFPLGHPNLLRELARRPVVLLQSVFGQRVVRIQRPPGDGGSSQRSAECRGPGLGPSRACLRETAGRSDGDGTSSADDGKALWRALKPRPSGGGWSEATRTVGVGGKWKKRQVPLVTSIDAFAAPQVDDTRSPALY
ncbi:hypothetical protein CHU98_g2349 [Xylaria longipes]|nr:hypothetical protein CHU98_g2349 [Xylaria longipes]